MIFGTILLRDSFNAFNLLNNSMNYKQAINIKLAYDTTRSLCLEAYNMKLKDRWYT